MFDIEMLSVAGDRSPGAGEELLIEVLEGRVEMLVAAAGSCCCCCCCNAGDTEL